MDDQPKKRTVAVTIAFFLLEDTGVIIERHEDIATSVTLVYDHHDARRVLKEKLRDELAPPTGEKSTLDQLLEVLGEENELPPVSTKQSDSLPASCVGKIDELLLRGIEVLRQAPEEELDDLFEELVTSGRGMSYCWISSPEPHPGSSVLVVYATASVEEPLVSVVASSEALKQLVRESEKTSARHRAQLKALFPDLVLAQGRKTPMHFNTTVAKIIVLGYAASNLLIGNAARQTAIA